MRTRQQWVQLIRDDLNNAVTGIIDAGTHLVEARAELGLIAVPMQHTRDAWMAFITEAGLKEATASKLMAIAKNPVLTDVKYRDRLPAQWTTLYELTTVNEKRLREWLDNEKITVRTTRADVAVLKGQKPKQRNDTPPKLAGPSKKELAGKVKHLEAVLADAETVGMLEEFDLAVERKTAERLDGEIDEYLVKTLRELGDEEVVALLLHTRDDASIATVVRLLSA